MSNFTRVRHEAFGVNTSGGTVTYTLASSVTSGNLIIVVTGNAGTSAVCTAVSGNNVGAFTKTYDSGSVASVSSMQVWTKVAASTPGSAEQITLTYSAATVSDACLVYEWNGNSASPINGTASGTANTGAAGDITTSGSLSATANVGDLIFGCASNYYGVSLAWTKGSTGPTNFSDGTNSTNFDVQSSRGSSDGVAHIVAGYRELTVGDGSYSGGGSFHVQKVSGAVFFMGITAAGGGVTIVPQRTLMGVGI